MDHRNTLPHALIDGHLAEAAIEALASDRGDLLDAGARAHHGACAECGARVRDAQQQRAAIDAAFEPPDGALSDALDRALIDAGLSEDALSAMVRTAIDAPDAAAPSPAPVSGRSLTWAFALGSIAAVALGLLSLDGLPSISGSLSSVARLWTLGSATSRLVQGTLPGGWASVALGLSLLLLGLIAPLRRLLASPHPTVASAAALLLLASLGVAAPAHALDFTGTWPEEEALTVVADDVPASIALEEAATAAGLGFVGALSDDPHTHLRVRGASLREVVIAVLGPDAPYVVDRSATLLSIRPALAARPTPNPATANPATANPTTPSPATPSPATPSPPNTPTPNPPTASARPVVDEAARRNARDRASFGGNVRVGPGEVVASVVTMGGNADIEGVVLQDVVSMGGNVHVHPTGSVRGEIVTMGGEVQVDTGADVTPEAVQTTDPHWGEWEPWGDGASEHDGPGDALMAWAGDTLASGARHALLFLFGLLLLGLSPARLGMVTSTLRTLPGRSILTGTLSAAASVVLALVLLITVIGIPGAVVLALAAAVAAYAGLVAVAMILGHTLPVPALKDKPVLQLGAGVAIFFVASLVPFFGGLAVFIAGLFGFGAVVLTRAGTRAA